MTTEPRVGGPAQRVPVLLQGVLGLLLAALLLAATLTATAALAGLVVVSQVLLVLGFLALVDAPAARGVFAVCCVTTAVADVVVLRHHDGVGGLAGVLGLALVGSLLHQLLRRNRNRVTESVADTLLAVALVCAAACLLALRRQSGGRAAVVVCLVAAGAALLAGRLGDRVTARPVLAAGATRGWPGLLLGLGAGTVAAVAGGGGRVTGSRAALLGLVAALAVSAADLAVDVAAAELRAGWRDARRVAALRPVGLLLPFAVLGALGFVAGRLVLR